MAEHVHKAGEKPDYNHITGGIYVGNNQCCSSGLSEVLKKEGITADISLEDERLDHPYGVDIYVWLPTPNHFPPNKDQLSLGVMALGDMLKQGRKVYVHCQNGHGRAPTLVAAYLISQGHSPEEAEGIVKKGRPSIHLEENQKQALQEFAREYRKP